MRRFCALIACCAFLAACDDRETVSIPLDGYGSYKEKVTKDVCAEWPAGLVKATHDRPQVEIIRNKCAQLGYPLSIRPPQNYTPPCDYDEHRNIKIPQGAKQCGG